MKKLILILLISILIFSGCTNKTVSTDNINVNDIDSITILTLPSPPKEKRINEMKDIKREDIKKIIDIVNSIKKEKINKQDTKGWTLSIHTFGKKEHIITFSGDNVVIDKLVYKINNADIDKVKNLYNELDYKENSYIKP